MALGVRRQGSGASNGAKWVFIWGNGEHHHVC